MCASYGLDPRMGDYKERQAEFDRLLIEQIRDWAEKNQGATLKPTGIRERKLNPIIRDLGQGAELDLGWWGFLVDGKPSEFPSINTRSERLLERPGNASGRALVPATSWLEMQKPEQVWWNFGFDLDLFYMAAVTQAGRPEGGESVTCYSIVMRPAVPHITQLHDRMPLLVPVEFASIWLDPEVKPNRQLIEETLAASAPISNVVVASRS